jgi:hypothetical protein
MFRSALLFSFFAVFAAAQTNSDAPSDPLEPANSALHAGDIDVAVTLLQALVAKDPPVAAARPLLVTSCSIRTRLTPPKISYKKAWRPIRSPANCTG